MVKRSKEISTREGKVNHNAPFIWFLAKDDLGRPRKFAINPFNRDHELDCADFLVGLLRDAPDRLNHWDYDWSKPERTAYGKFKFNFDRRFVLDDYLYFLEVDRGTKDIDAVEQQISKYVGFSNTYLNEPFNLLISVLGYRHESAERRAENILNILGKFKRGNQFLVGLHTQVTADPLGKVWKSPLNPNGFLALSDLE